jgi:pimeloyl-ACP methyl ester carboxylesterase
MGSSSSKYTINHGKPMKWKPSDPLFSLWKDKDDDLIEAIRVPANNHQEVPIFKLQRRSLSSDTRIIARDYTELRQVTILEALTEEDARLGYRYLVNVVLNAGDLISPENVKLALENRETLPGIRFHNLINPHNNLFTCPLLQPLHECWNPADFEADIILVHGLGGDSQTTWFNDAGLWPIVWLFDLQNGINSMPARYNIRDLPPVNKIRLLTVKHHANMFSTDNESDPRYIAQRLVGLLFDAGVGSKPIVWIAHSLGGLIVKEILYASQRGLRCDILRSTKGVIFFGTPHCGATWATAMRAVDSMHDSPGLLYLDPSPSIGAQAGNGQRLQALNEFFSGTTIPFLNFSEGALCSPPFLSLLSALMTIIVVPDAQAHIMGSVTVSPLQMEEQLSMGTFPPRVHEHCKTI